MTTVHARLSLGVRRAKIVRSTIAIIAEAGYDTATFARIAAHAGLTDAESVSDYFPDQEALLHDVAGSIFQHSGDFLRSRIYTHASPSAAVLAYVVARIEFHTQFPHLHVVIDEIRCNLPLRDRRPILGLDDFEPEIAQLEELMRKAQIMGEMIWFDTRIMAINLHSMLDGALREIQAGRTDPVICAAELARFVTAGTRQQVQV